MTTLALRFPAGRYHATPWGHHVNEGIVEWPPSPWRLLRALISVGYATLGWDDGVPEAACRLVSDLASVSPVYTLPSSGVGHSRHYMPLAALDGAREKTSLVFDAFARPGDGVLSVTWPVDLDPEARSLLGTLATNLGYLGRAESWVEAALLPSDSPAPPGTPCWPSAPGSQAPGRGWEQVNVLAPTTSEDYAIWREAEVSAILARPELQPTGKGKLTPALKRKRDQATAPYPLDLWSCLTASTSSLQAAGWSRPPGSQRLLYWRRSDALEVAPAAGRHSARTEHVEALLLAISLPSGNSHALPPAERTLPQAELLHRAAIGLLGRGMAVESGSELVGRDLAGRPLTGHRHAHVLPLDLDGDGHLDHALFWAPGGFGPEAQAAVRALRETWTKGGDGSLRVAVAAAGSLGVLSGLPDPWGANLRRLTGPATRWRSATPFVPPRHVKARGANTLEGQIQAELAGRGFPAAASVRVFDRDEALGARFRHFVLERARGGPPPPVRCWYGLEIRFDVPVEGPICLGYAAHFGLGRLEAAGG